MKEVKKTPTEWDCKLASALQLVVDNNWILAKMGIEKLSNFPEKESARLKLIELAKDQNKIDPIRNAALNSLNFFDHPDVKKCYEDIINGKNENKNYIDKAKQNLENFLQRNSKK